MLRFVIFKKPSAQIPRHVYRSLDEEQHALDLLKGWIRVSTLEWLRNTERQRGDPDEATIHYEHGSINSNEDTPENRQVLANLANMGFVIEPGGQYLINTERPIQITHRPSNGYLVCTSTRPPTEKMRRLFGHYCVKIAEPEAFVQAIGRALLREGLVTQEHFYGPVNYGGRRHAGATAIPAPAAFTGAPDAAHEGEYRFFWTPSPTARVEPVVVYSPELGRLCSRFG